MAALTITSLEALTLKEIYALAKEYKVSYYAKLTKKELIFAILKAQAEKDGFLFMDGILEIIPSEGFGFLRPINYSASAEDIYISASQIRRFDLRNGDKVSGKVRPPKENERYYGLLHVDAVNDDNPESAKERIHFPGLTALYPDRFMQLEQSNNNLSTRIMDLMSPVGFGQRGLIVAAPKAGKTMLLKEIANSISKNHPTAKLIILLVDERPEEVTDIERSVDENVDVVSSTFDEVPENHIKISELVLERAMRLVEHKQDVFKGTGNMELHLDRHLANRRIFPAIDIMKSGTRKEELLVSENQLDKMWTIRNTMQDTQEFTERFLRRLKQTKTNEDFLDSIDDDMNKRASKK